MLLARAACTVYAKILYTVTVVFLAVVAAAAAPLDASLDARLSKLAPTEAAHELLATGIPSIQPECVDESSKTWCDKWQALLKKAADINATKKQAPAYKSRQDRIASRCGQCGKDDSLYLNNTEWDELSDDDKKETDVAAMHKVFLTCTAQPAQQCPSLPPSAPPPTSPPATPPPLATTTTEVCGCACKVRVPCTYFRS